MENLIAAVRAALVEQNWYAALGMALTLPDICGKIRDPKTRSSAKRYAAWIDEYLAPKWGPFLGGNDTYALRCAVLHEGSLDIHSQQVRQVHDGFIFIAFDSPGSYVHMNVSENRLQLQVDIFCEQICAGVETWLSQVYGSDSEISARIDAMMSIRVLRAGDTFAL